MSERTFSTITSEEIKDREKMYEEAASLGIDLMGYDGSQYSAEERRDVRKAVVLLGTGKKVPDDLKERLLRRKKYVADKAKGV